jgi:hypothetical protein
MEACTGSGGLSLQRRGQCDSEHRERVECSAPPTVKGVAWYCSVASWGKNGARSCTKVNTRPLAWTGKVRRRALSETPGEPPKGAFGAATVGDRLITSSALAVAQPGSLWAWAAPLIVFLEGLATDCCLHSHLDRKISPRRARLARVAVASGDSSTLERRLCAAPRPYGTGPPIAG